MAALAWRRLRPGAAALLVCFVLGAALTFNHPNHQNRYLHSWLAAGWAMAGVGLTVLLPRRFGTTAGGVALVGLAWLVLPGWWLGGAAPAGGPRPEEPSLLELADFYADEVRSARKPVVLSEVPFRFAARWAALEQCSDPDAFDCVECFRGGLTPPWALERQGVLDWLTGCDCDTIVAVEDGPEEAYWEYIIRGRRYDPLGVLLREQGGYRLVKRQAFPRHNCVVTVWRRRGD